MEMLSVGLLDTDLSPFLQISFSFSSIRHLMTSTHLPQPPLDPLPPTPPHTLFRRLDQWMHSHSYRTVYDAITVQVATREKRVFPV